MPVLIRGDARALPLTEGCVQCVVTSPPYFGLRDYGTATWHGGKLGCDHKASREFVNPKNTLWPKGHLPATNAANQMHQRQFRGLCEKCGATSQDAQLGLEATPAAYVAALVAVFREVRRVLTADGVAWLNLGDSYAGGGNYRGLNSENSLSAKQRSNRGATGVCQLLGAAGKDTGPAKPKDLIGIPWKTAFALQADGWYLRSDIIWSKPNPMPESVTDRPTKAHEYLFLLSKSERYFYDADAIAEPATRTLRPSEEKNGFYHSGEYGVRATQHGRKLHWGYRGEATKDYDAAGAQNPSDTKRRILDAMAEPDYPGRNKRSVWTIPTMPYAGAHFATMPEALVEPCILAGSRLGDLILDPFSGSGTVLAVAARTGRRGVGVDLNPAYHQLAKVRTQQRGLRWVAND